MSKKTSLNIKQLEAEEGIKQIKKIERYTRQMGCTDKRYKQSAKWYDEKRSLTNRFESKLDKMRRAHL